tara:strand:- start:668 stop:1312 length:645 start_codon:yes stop_codon:yes gene_type:complete
MEAKICGVKNSKTLNYIINHNFAPKYIGFICNYPKSKRNIKYKNLKNLIKINKKKTKFVAVLVKPQKRILEMIKDLKFDFYQLYNVTPDKTKMIKKKYKKKIITALTISSQKDVYKYNKYKKISDIILFDGKGYENSIGFDHSLIINIPKNVKKMLAGNIKYNDNLEKFIKITDIIDLSGSLETNGNKDFKKINIFLKNLNKINVKNKKKNSIN